MSFKAAVLLPGAPRELGGDTPGFATELASSGPGRTAPVKPKVDDWRF